MAVKNASSSKFAALLDSAVDAIVLIDAQGNITEFSSAAQRLFGYQPDEVVGHNVSMLMPEPFHSQHDSYLRNYSTTRQAKIIGKGREVIAQRNNGEQFPIDLSVGEFRNGDHTGYVGIIRDITKRKQVEMELRESEKELALTIGNAPFGILTTDLKLQILTANQACLDLFKLSLKDIQRRRLPDLIYPEDRPLTAREMGKMIRGETANYRELCRLESNNNKILTCRVHSTLVRDDIGQPRFVVTELADLTAQLKAEQDALADRERLAHAMRVSILGEMSSSIAHELNQPLAAITLLSETASRLVANETKTEQLQKALEKISHQAIRAGDIIKRLRTFVSQPKGVREKIQLLATINDAIELAAVDFRSENIALQFDKHCGEFGLYADPLQLQQVVLNLIRNAYDAIRDQGQTDGRIEVCCERNSSHCDIHVIDNGPGVSDDMAPQLFEAFASSKQEGMGIGLSLSRSIVEAHGGRLTYQLGEHGGAHFTVSLPLPDSNKS